MAFSEWCADFELKDITAWMKDSEGCCCYNKEHIKDLQRKPKAVDTKRKVFINLASAKNPEQASTNPYKFY